VFQQEGGEIEAMKGGAGHLLPEELEEAPGTTSKLEDPLGRMLNYGPGDCLADHTGAREVVKRADRPLVESCRPM